MRPWHPLILAVLMGPLVAACSTGTDACDPRVSPNVLQASYCNLGGGHEDFIAGIRADTERTVAETQLTRAETDRLEAEAQVLAKDQAKLDARINDLDRDLAGLRRRLDTIDTSTAEARARREVLERELTSAELRTAGARVDPPETAAEIARLETDVARKRKAINDVLNSMGVVE